MNFQYAAFLLVIIKHVKQALSKAAIHLFRLPPSEECDCTRSCPEWEFEPVAKLHTCRSTPHMSYVLLGYIYEQTRQNVTHTCTHTKGKHTWCLPGYLSTGFVTAHCLSFRCTRYSVAGGDAQGFQISLPALWKRPRLCRKLSVSNNLR